MYIPESPAGLVGYFTIRQTVVLSAIGAVKLCGQDPQRVLLVVSVTTGVAGRIGISQSVVAGVGGFPIAVGSNFPMDFQSFGALVNSEWWSAAGAGTTYTVTETIYKPPTE